MDHVQDRPVLRKFTSSRRERIVGAASSGAFKKHIAQLAEIDPDTLQRWIDMGEKDHQNDLDTELAEFYTDWQRARGVGAISTLKDCSDEFIAERAYGYTKTQEVQHSGDGMAIALPESVTDEWERNRPE
jgi:transposase-like protein